MRFLTQFATGIVGALAFLFSPSIYTTSAFAQSEVAEATIPVEVWSLRPVVNAVQISPDGRHILVHKTESREGDYLLEITRRMSC